MAFSIRVIVAVSCLGVSTAASALDYGRTKGSAGVSSSGAATYTIPIWTPPGPNGLTPVISLNYNSQVSNGLVGVGWTLNATLSIERCPRTKHQDSSAAAVDLSANDRFCINGNRLRLASGSYGAAGSVYFTEIADFSRITLYGGPSVTGPEHFIVEAKNGLYYEYGKAENSRVMLGTTALRWMLSKVRDRSGNNYVVTYRNEFGFAYPDVISWTPTTSGASTYRYEAKFNYFSDRSDADSYLGRLASHYLMNESRLESIQIKSAGVVVRKYLLGYDISPTTSRSRLTSVKECSDNADSNCLLPTTFTYQSPPAGVVPGAGLPPAGSSNGLIPGRYDFNGDGKNDIVYINGGSCRAALGANTGFAGPYNVGAPSCGIIDRFMPNGRDAIAVTVSGTRWIYRWDDATSAFLAVNTGAGNGETASADYDGDGLADLLRTSGPNVWLYRNTSSSASSNPTFASASLVATLPNGAFGGTPNFDSVTAYFGNGLQRADLNGDGRQEIFALVMVNLGIGGATPYSMVLQASSAGYLVPPTSSWTSPAPHFSINFNGDACTDRVLSSTVYISQCKGTEATTLAAPATPSLILDWNGDDKSDFLIWSGGSYSVYLSTGAGFSSPIATSITSGSSLYAFDQDGDRLEDIIGTNGVSAISYWTHTAGGYVPTTFATNIPDLLSSATDGFGVSFTPGYVSTAWSNYDNQPQALFPLQEAAPRIVVAQSTISDGIGGSYNKYYYYTASRTYSGRNDAATFLRVDETDARNGLISRTYFDQTFPVGGMVSQREIMQPNGVTPIRRATFANNFATLPNLPNIAKNDRFFRYVSGSSKTEFEMGGMLNGALLRTVQTTDFFDNETGTVHDHFETTTEPASANGITAGGSWTKRIYAPVPQFLTDTTNWCIGRPQYVQQINSTNLPSGTPLTRTTSRSWDAALCRLTQTVDEPGSSTLQVITDIGYDDFGNVQSTTVTGIDMDPRVTEMKYSDANNKTGQFLLSVTNALSETSSVSWNYDLGVPLTDTDANGITTSRQFDPYGRTIRENRPDGTYSTFEYLYCGPQQGCDSRARMWIDARDLSASGGLVRRELQFFDQFDRLFYHYDMRHDSLYDVNTQTFDALGNVVKAYFPFKNIEAHFGQVTTVYDALNRPTSISRPVSSTNPALQTTSIYYKGLVTEIVDPLAHATTTTLNGVGQVAKTADGNGYFQRFEYDPFGNLKRTIDSVGDTLQEFDYDLRGGIERRVDMDFGTWQFTPNALGESVSQVDAKGQLTKFRYDLLGRIYQREDPEGVSYFNWGNSVSAKNIGKLASISGPGSYSEVYSYDSFGRPSEATIYADGSHQINFDYNDIGLLNSLTYPTSTSGYRLKLKYEYQNGHLARIKDFNPPEMVFWDANSVNARGQITQETLGDSLITVRNNYDPVTGWLSSINTGLGGGTGVQNLTYEWDLVGNLKKRRDLNQASLTEEFFYDNVHRLDYSLLNGVQNLNLDYDQLGNITSKSDVGSYTYHPSRKHQVTSTSNGWSFGYDSNGNMTSGRGSSIDWTGFNYPSCIRKGSACSGTGTDWSAFSYTPNRDYWKQVSNYVSGGTATTIYVGGLLEKVTAAGVTDYRHMIRAGNSAIIVSRKSSGANTVNYITQDHLGSSSVIANASGGILVNSSFDAFGKRRGSNWSGNPSAGEWTAIASTTRRGYTDHSMVDNLGLIHMNGRVHDPALGRFLSADPYITDPLNTQNYNRYSYVYNNPLSFTDPNGFDPDEACQHQGSAGCLPEIAVECDTACQAAERAKQAELEQFSGRANSHQSFQITQYSAMANEFLGNLLGVKTLDCVLFENCGGKPYGEAVIEAGLDRIPVTKVLSLTKNMVIAAKAARAAKSLGTNPFAGKSANEVAQMFERKGYVPKGPDPAAGRGTYVNPQTGRGYHIDANHPDPKGPHVGVHRPRDMRDTLDTRDYSMGGP